MQKPALDKVAEVTEALGRVETKETEIRKAETQRTANEAQRQTDETERQQAELLRNSQFATLKQSAEAVITTATVAATGATTAANNAQTAANIANEAAGIANEAASNIAAAKLALFDSMWASIGGTKLDNGMYRMTAAGKELTLDEALVRYERNGFIQKWNTATPRYISGESYKYNEFTCLYELNGFTDIDFAEANRIYDAYIGDGAPLNARTTFADGNGLRYFLQPSIDPSRYTNTSIVKLVGVFDAMTSTGASILNTHTLKEIKYLRIGDASNSVYIESLSLEIIYFTAQNKNAKVFRNFNIKNASKFRLDGMGQITQWVKNSTVIVHPDVYAKLTGDTTNAAAAALSEEEFAQWQAILTTAESKNITIATV